MALNKYKLGVLIEQSDARNDDLIYSLDDVKGISIQKCFIETKADMDGVSLRPYKLVEPDSFAYVTVTSRNGEKITLAHNVTDNTYIVSSSYIVFKVINKNIILPDYLFMYFNRPEFDRYSRFSSWGSARETFSWEDMCDIEIELPCIEIQQKYVDVYNAMLENQKSYERGLEDLKLVCDSALDKIKEGNCIKLGKIIEKRDCKNIDNYLGKEAVRGITNKKQFDSTKADLRGTDLSKFLIVHKGEFAYNSRTDGRDMLVLALNREENSIIVTFNYNVFGIKDKMKNSVNTEFLYTLFKRTEFDRKVRFDSWGSSQELFSWESLCDLDIPFPSVEIQNSIASINEAYINRTNINEKLKSQIKTLCPILIKGSIEEAKRS